MRDSAARSSVKYSYTVRRMPCVILCVTAAHVL
jgi:hypothetical protein